MPLRVLVMHRRIGVVLQLVVVPWLSFLSMARRSSGEIGKLGLCGFRFATKIEAHCLCVQVGDPR
jgi:hypothetical protein